MASVNIEQNLELPIPGLSVPFRIGTVGRGKGASKVRVVPQVKDFNTNLMILKAFPQHERMLQDLVAKQFRDHSSACISEPPSPLTEETLKEWLGPDGGFAFDSNTLNECIEEDYAQERAGKVSANKRLAEWQASNAGRLAELAQVLVTSTQKGEQADADVVTELQKLVIEQSELTAQVEEEAAAKEARRSKRLAKAA